MVFTIFAKNVSLNKKQKQKKQKLNVNAKKKNVKNYLKKDIKYA